MGQSRVCDVGVLKRIVADAAGEIRRYLFEVEWPEGRGRVGRWIDWFGPQGSEDRSRCMWRIERDKEQERRGVIMGRVDR